MYGGPGTVTSRIEWDDQPKPRPKLCPLLAMGRTYAYWGRLDLLEQAQGDAYEGYERTVDVSAPRGRCSSGAR